MRAICASPSPGSTADQGEQAGADGADDLAIDVARAASVTRWIRASMGGSRLG